MTKRQKDLERIATQIRRCRMCPLHKGRKMAVPGEGPYNARIVFVGEAPGRDEDEQGRPFVGAAGKILNDALLKSGLEREDVFITSILKCRPPRNRNPKAPEMRSCRPYLLKQIEIISPRVLVALGGYGLKALTGRTMKVGESRRKRLRFEDTPIVVTYHPAAVLRNRNLMERFVADLRKAKSQTRRRK